MKWSRYQKNQNHRATSYHTNGHTSSNRRGSKAAKIKPIIAPNYAPPTPLGALSSLPAEIRAMIYSFLIAAGSTSIMRASKALDTDTKTAFKRNAVYRAHIQCSRISHTLWPPYLPFEPMPTDAILTDVRDLNIVINTVNFYPQGIYFWNEMEYPLEPLITRLTVPMSVHRSCYVRLLYGPNRELASETLAAMRKLRDFKYVTIELCQQPWARENSSEDHNAENRIRHLLCSGQTDAKPKLSIVHTTGSGLDVRSLWKVRW